MSVSECVCGNVVVVMCVVMSPERDVCACVLLSEKEREERRFITSWQLFCVSQSVGLSVRVEEEGCLTTSDDDDYPSSLLEKSCKRAGDIFLMSAVRTPPPDDNLSLCVCLLAPQLPLICHS